MQNPNFLNKVSSNDNHNSHETDTASIITEWDTLREIPFAGEQQKPIQIKSELREKLSDFQKFHQGRKLSPQSFLFQLLCELQPVLLSGGTQGDLFDDYSYWKDVLREIEPILRGFWPECDPMIVSYLFSVFVTEFMVMLRFWHDVGFSDYCVKDCTLLCEFYLGIGIVHKGMLTSLAERWNVTNDGLPTSLE